jgi:hypothetical protein
MMTYAESLYAALADRDPIAVFQETPARLRQLTTSVDDAALRRAERDGKWSMLQVAQHLADSELVVGWRYRLISAQDGATITAYDQDQWVSSLWRGDERLADVLDQFEALRAANLRLLSRLTPEQWEHAGLHEERGREPMRPFVRLIAGHDVVHLRQVERVRAAVTT